MLNAYEFSPLGETGHGRGCVGTPSLCPDVPWELHSHNPLQHAEKRRD